MRTALLPLFWGIVACDLVMPLGGALPSIDQGPGIDSIGDAVRVVAAVTGNKVTCSLPDLGPTLTYTESLHQRRRRAVHLLYRGVVRVRQGQRPVTCRSLCATSRSTADGRSRKWGTNPARSRATRVAVEVREQL